ncbi:hypothetical protein Tco_1400926 [Tanacetum coccineum]
MSALLLVAQEDSSHLFLSVADWLRISSGSYAAGGIYHGRRLAQPSETQFKVPQGKDLRDGRRTQKTTGKQPIVDLDEDDDDDMPGRRNLTRWNKNEEMLLAETWIEHSQDANIRKDQQDNCKELEFFMLDPSSLPPAKRAIIEKKQAEIMKKYPDT